MTGGLRVEPVFEQNMILIGRGLFDRIPVRMPNWTSFAAVLNVLKIPFRVFSSLLVKFGARFTPGFVR